MYFREFFRYILSFSLCFIFAAFILNFVLYNYYLLPEKINIQAATETRWGANSKVVLGTEGYGVNLTDEKGYNNAFNINENSNYILLFGSSHTQGFNVNQEETYSYIMTKKLSDNNFDILVYNIGMDGHGFDTIIQHFKAAMEQFRDAHSVIIEVGVGSIEYNKAAINVLKKATSSQVNYVSYTENENISLLSKITRKLQLIPIVRLAYKQIVSFKFNFSNVFFAQTPKKVVKEKTSDIEYHEYYEVLVDTLMILKQQAKGKNIIIIYHPQLKLNKDGSAIDVTDKISLDLFQSACAQSGVQFYNMSEKFLEMYYIEQKLPHGFFNSKLSEGHLNRYGNKKMAEALYTLILKNQRVYNNDF